MTEDQLAMSALISAKGIIKEIRASEAYKSLSRETKRGVNFLINNYPSRLAIRDCKKEIKAAVVFRSFENKEQERSAK